MFIKYTVGTRIKKNRKQFDAQRRVKIFKMKKNKIKKL